MTLFLFSNCLGASLQSLLTAAAVAQHDAAGLSLPPGLQGLMPGIPIIPGLSALSHQEYAARAPPQAPVNVRLKIVNVNAESKRNELTDILLQLLCVNLGIDQSTNGSHPSPAEKASGIPRPGAGPTSLWSSASLPVREGDAGEEPLPADENLLVGIFPRFRTKVSCRD